MWAIALILSVAAGYGLACAMLARAWRGPRWAVHTAAAACGALFGPGLASVLFFAAILMGVAGPSAAIAIPAALVVAGAITWWKAPAASEPRVPSAARFPWTWALAGALLIAAVFLALDFQTTTAANPEGEWDASAIWNLRARYLAGGPEVWRRAVSAETGGGMGGSPHPGYPLFLSSFLAMQWTAAGSYTTLVPITTGLLISLALLCLLVTGLSVRGSPSRGLLAGLVLVATELYASQTASQYSDLLLGLAFLAALVLLDSAGSPRMLLAAGLAIGLAPWIKNEGQPFAIAAIAVAAWRFRGRIAWVLLGAAPGFAATAFLKLISEGREAMFPATLGEALVKLGDLSRWKQSLAGFGKGVLDAGPLWAHPVLLAAALAIALQFVPAAERRARLWLSIPIAATLAAEFGLFLITTADLAWHLSTSVVRLLAQVWPALLWLLFSMLRAPEEYFATPREPVAAPASRARPTKKAARLDKPRRV